jgi:plastocyanin
MRKLVLMAAVVVAALAGAATSSGATLTISITATGYVPTGGSIKVGDTVTWANNDTVAHQVQFARYPSCNLNIQPGRSASCTFTQVGTFIFVDPVLSQTPRGSIDVTGTNLGTTLQASRKAVVYGTSVRLAGRLGSGEAGQAIDLLARPFGATAFTVTGRTTTKAGGTWSFTEKPKEQTQYRVRVAGTESGSVTVSVRPRITLAYRGGAFSARVLAGRSYAGKVVSLQRSVGGTWRTFATGTLRANGAVSIRVKPPAGRSTVRVLVPASQSPSGYSAGTSAPLAVKR